MAPMWKATMKEVVIQLTGWLNVLSRSKMLILGVLRKDFDG